MRVYSGAAQLADVLRQERLPVKCVSYMRHHMHHRVSDAADLITVQYDVCAQLFIVAYSKHSLTTVYLQWDFPR
jgi:hypothetical protein